MFLGTYAPRLDEKGRIILPAKFADELAEGVVMTRGQERCVYVFSAAEFGRMHERIRQAPVTSRDARNYLRVFLSGAHDETPDKQRRVTIPPALRAYAGLDRELAVLGVGDRVEIWDAKAWETYLAEQEDAFSETSGEVVPGIL
ncbi:division/cell wall cluster transcriptional repressor MraZ [Amnibacterium sp. CER49]|uniref:division/cell wall cluster transcriptional repressor MraZ n=1 Tax=Amnibacterium sp. CER49 TaxID=3039161 RepID=UPI0024497C0C|nr:division/cell wall cluster transcriptional repressor MraZ [Amnibacterium sp. CER49]MDH2444713.1 division/cell wall cluster transcriptional repressor MraZ [Amnibacterium sp. CER49]